MMACGASYLPGHATAALPAVASAARRVPRSAGVKRLRGTGNLLAELPATHAGLLRRRRLLLGWSKPRMFVVKSGYLLCHPGASEHGQPNVVDLDGCSVVGPDQRTARKEERRHAAGKAHGFEFTLLSPMGKPVMRLKAATKEERGVWMARLGGVRRRHLSDFRHIATLGTGAYGQVSLVRETTASAAAVPAPEAPKAGRAKLNTSIAAEGDGAEPSPRPSAARFYALKQVALTPEGDRSATNLRRAAEERAVLQRAGNHPFITQLHYAFLEGGRLHYVQELGNGGDLYENARAQPRRRFSEEAVRFFAAEVLLAIGHLHSLGILHRDIKLENVLLDEQGHVMLADFGLAKTLRNGVERTRSFVGTERYCPPEMWMDVGHGRAVDFWQLGCLMFELLTGRPPFYSRDKDRQRKAILSGKLRFPADLELSDNAKSLVEGLLARHVWERLGAGDDDIREVQRHPFFEGVDWDAVLARRVTPPYTPPHTAAYLAQLNSKDEEAKKKAAAAVPAEKSGPASAPSKLQKCLEAEFIGFDYCWEDSNTSAGADKELGLLASDDEDSPSSNVGAPVALPAFPSAKAVAPVAVASATGAAGAGAGAGAGAAASPVAAVVAPAAASAPTGQTKPLALSLPERLPGAKAWGHADSEDSDRPSPPAPTPVAVARPRSSRLAQAAALFVGAAALGAASALPSEPAVTRPTPVPVLQASRTCPPLRSGGGGATLTAVAVAPADVFSCASSTGTCSSGSQGYPAVLPASVATAVSA